MNWCKYVCSKLNNACNAYVIKGKFRKCLLEEVGLEKMLGVNYSQHRGEWHYRHRTLWPKTQKGTWQNCIDIWMPKHAEGTFWWLPTFTKMRSICDQLPMETFLVSNMLRRCLDSFEKAICSFTKPCILAFKHLYSVIIYEKICVAKSSRVCSSCFPGTRSICIT